MYVFVRVCMCVHIYIFTCMYIYIYLYTYKMRTYIQETRFDHVGVILYPHTITMFG